MVEYSADLDLVFHALSGAPRRAILEELADEGDSITEIAAAFDMSLAGVSKHVRVLERAGLVTRSREGRVHRISARVEPLVQAASWIERHRASWERRFDALEQLVTRPRQR